MRDKSKSYQNLDDEERLELEIRILTEATMGKIWKKTPMKYSTAYVLCEMLQARYGEERARLVIEVCPVSVLKTIDNEEDALSTIRNIKEANK